MAELTIKKLKVQRLKHIKTIGDIYEKYYRFALMIGFIVATMTRHTEGTVKRDEVFDGTAESDTNRFANRIQNLCFLLNQTGAA